MSVENTVRLVDTRENLQVFYRDSITTGIPESRGKFRQGGTYDFFADLTVDDPGHSNVFRQGEHLRDCVVVKDLNSTSVIFELTRSSSS